MRAYQMRLDAVMALEFKGNQLRFDPYWERARVIDRLRHIFTGNFSELVACGVPDGGVLQVLSGPVLPSAEEGRASLYKGLGVTIARLDIDSKDLCSVRTYGERASRGIDGLYDLRTTTEDLQLSTIPPEETYVDEYFNRVLERPVFFRGLGEFSLYNIVGQPTSQVAPEMAWHLAAPGYEAQFTTIATKTSNMSYKMI